MYLTIDVGGTKTLLAVFDEDGNLQKKHKFPTNLDYEQFKSELAQNITEQLSDYQFSHCCCAVPGRINRESGIVEGFGNLGWSDIPFKADLSNLLNIPIYIENDANLAGLSEAQLVHDKYKKVLYITISTGIGDGIIIDGVIDPGLADSEPGNIIFERDGIIQTWEHVASGKAIVKKYGKIAAEIDDPEIWKAICKDIGLGLIDAIVTIEPEVVIIGGGVGSHFQKFGEILNNEIQSYKDKLSPTVSLPPVIGAQHPEEAVIYGCYELIRQNLAKTN